MPAELFGDRFYGGRGLAAWHNRGFVDSLQHTANEAFDLMHEGKSIRSVVVY